MCIIKVLKQILDLFLCSPTDNRTLLFCAVKIKKKSQHYYTNYTQLFHPITTSNDYHSSSAITLRKMASELGTKASFDNAHPPNMVLARNGSINIS